NLSEAEVRTATCVDEAMKVFNTWQPEVIISDIAMPNGDGYELIRRVRQQERSSGRKILAIAVTGNASTKDRIHALTAGFQLHLPKLIEPEELVISVASLIGRDKKSAEF